MKLVLYPFGQDPIEFDLEEIESINPHTSNLIEVQTKLHSYYLGQFIKFE